MKNMSVKKEMRDIMIFLRGEGVGRTPHYNMVGFKSLYYKLELDRKRRLLSTTLTSWKTVYIHQ